MDDPDVRWLTYDEAAQLLNIKPDSVRRRAASRKWPRRLGNDKLARVGVPQSIIPERTPEGSPDVTPDDPDISDDFRVRLASSEAENKLLRIQVEDLRADRDAWRKQAERLSESRAGIFSRLFRR